MAKKDFSNKQNPVLNPAMRFITAYKPPQEAETDKVENAGREDTQVQPTSSTPTPVKKTDIRKRERATEKKTRRVNLVMQPSVMEGIDKIATMRRSSVNDLVNSVLRDYVQQEKETIARFDDVFGK